MSNSRRLMFVAITMVAVASLVFASPAEAQRRASAQVGPNCSGSLQTLFDEIEQGTLTPAEVEELVYVREEEKLARDVYLALGDRWQLPIFTNIAGAEQRHMDLVYQVMEIYGVTDPVVDQTPGFFSDPTFTSMYEDLVAQGDADLVAALSVGAFIEEIDLIDLYDLLAFTDNDHLKFIAYNLAKGTRNHLRAFVRALDAQGVEYVPVELDSAIYDAVINAPMEQRIHYTADGEPVLACGAAVGGFGMGWGPGHGDGQGNGSCDGSGSNNNGSGECDGTGSHGNGSGGRAGGN